MKKIKITLTSGSVVEKNLLVAFKGTYGDYAVLDNESVGSMGLPVILISKLEGNKISTISDANEWNAIKENLRNIIAGNQIIKVNTLDQYEGEEIYYKQLTLPVASFDVLKKADDTDDTPSNPMEIPVPAPEVPASAPDVNASQVVEPTPVEPVAPVMPQMEAAPAPSDVVTPMDANVNASVQMNVNPDVVTPEQVINNSNMEVPTNPPMPEAPVSAPEINASQVVEPTPIEPVAPVMPQMETPSVEPVPNINEQVSDINFEEEKTVFLKACENMFDALVSKFNK